MPDLSWMPQIGLELTIALGTVGLAFVFFKWGLPVIKEMKAENLSAKETACGGLQARHEEQLNRIEKILTGQISRFDSIESGIEELSESIDSNKALAMQLSVTIQKNTLFNENNAPFRRLKAFRRLLALRENGRVWTTGLEVILANKDDKNNRDVWLDLNETELSIPIVDEEYYNEKMAEIRRRIYDDFSKTV